jgi:hypothetical protein
MSAVDLHVKHMLLSCPSVFKTRWDCMQHIFLDTLANGWRWSDAGAMYCNYGDGKPMPESIDLSELQAALTHIQGLEARSKSTEPRPTVSEVRIGREIHEREYRGAHIDAFVKMLDDEDIPPLELWELNTLARVPMGMIPDGALDLDWTEAAEAVALKFSAHISSHFRMYEPDFKPATMPERWSRIYKQLDVIIERLDVATGRKARITAALERYREPLSKIIRSATIRR